MLTKYEILYITKERAVQICLYDYCNAITRKLNKIFKFSENEKDNLKS